MSTLDDIVRERQRISERLAHLDEERAKLREELGELDAAERVLNRLDRAQRPAPGVGRQPAPPADAARLAPRRRRTRRQSVTTTPGPRSLGDATLQAVEALGSAVSAAEVRDYLAREFGMQVRANHLGMALQRHRRAGRLEQHASHWSVRGAAPGS